MKASATRTIIFIISLVVLVGGLAACGTQNTFVAITQHPNANEWKPLIESQFDKMTVLDMRAGIETAYDDAEKIQSVIGAIKNLEISEQPEIEQVKPGGFVYNITFENSTDSIIVSLPYFSVSSVSNEDFNTAVYAAKDTGKIITELDRILEKGLDRQKSGEGEDGVTNYIANGTLDVHGVRDLTPIQNEDGTIDPGGTLLGLS